MQDTGDRIQLRLNLPSPLYPVSCHLYPVPVQVLTAPGDKLLAFH